MTTYEPISVNDIQKTMRERGSHWWDAGTMRSFGTVVMPEVWHGPGGVYLVTRDLRYNDTEGWTLRKYDHETAQLDSVGDVASRMSATSALKAAKEAAGKGAICTKEKHRPITDADDLWEAIKKHAGVALSPSALNTLLRLATLHDQAAVDLCNGAIEQKQFDRSAERIRKHVARYLPSVGVLTGGDPRGCTCKLVFEDGATNDFGKEGWCVPVRNDDE